MRPSVSLNAVPRGPCALGISFEQCRRFTAARSARSSVHWASIRLKRNSRSCSTTRYSFCAGLQQRRSCMRLRRAAALSGEGRSARKSRRGSSGSISSRRACSVPSRSHPTIHRHARAHTLSCARAGTCTHSACAHIHTCARAPTQKSAHAGKRMETRTRMRASDASLTHMMRS